MNNTICILPWIHMNVSPSGIVSTCCISNHTIGDLSNNTLEEIWNDETIRKVRREMMNNIVPDSCKVCFEREQITGESVRLHRNDFFDQSISNISNITNSDGYVSEMKLKYWDFRFSNVCNYKCRSCSPESSSAWISDYKKLGWDIHYSPKEINFDIISSQINNVEFISFAGGEPLLMDEHWRILDLLIDNNRMVDLKYNTNLSVLSYKGKSVIDYWKKFKNIRVSPSIDEIGERAEIIRHGTIWNDIEKNINTIISISNIVVQVHITVSVFNVFRLPYIIEYLRKLGVQNFHLNMLSEPSYYHVSILPDINRHEIIQSLSIPFYLPVIHELKKPHDSNSMCQFLDITKKLDKIRNENTFEIIPELKCILKCNT